MAVRGYVLIETDVGKAKSVGAAIGQFTYPGARVSVVDTVTGPYDVIVQLEAEDLDALGERYHGGRPEGAGRAADDDMPGGAAGVGRRGAGRQVRRPGLKRQGAKSAKGHARAQLSRTSVSRYEAAPGWWE